MKHYCNILAVTVNGDSIDDIVSMTVTPGIALDPVKDQLGTVHAWVSVTTAAFEQKLTYTAYGETTITQSSPLLSGLGMQRAFTGREYDLDTELQHNRARWYYPSTGRWLSPDPIEFKSNDPNFYRYVSNTPILSRDSQGKSKDLIIVGGALLFGYLFYKFVFPILSKPILKPIEVEPNPKGTGVGQPYCNPALQSCEPGPQYCQV